MTKAKSNAVRGSGLRRVGLYYALLAVTVALLVRYVPWIGEVVGGTGPSGLQDGLSQVLGPNAPPPVGSVAGAYQTWEGAVVAGLSMLGALGIMVPVTWVYMVTRRQRGYDESVVHTMLILPVAVTGIVMIVQDSVALAFSLAGIVAAVRFRTTLDDTKDAVYVFLAIGVGLASGVQALGVALTLSLVFNAVVLVLWRTQFGNIYADGHARAGPLGVADVLAGPGSAQSALRVGDPAVLEAASLTEVGEIAERAVRFERHVSEERAKKKDRRANSLIVIHGSSAERAQAYVEPILEDMSVRWKLAEMEDGPAGTQLTYLARLDGPAAQGAVMDRIREGAAEGIGAAELRSLKGLKPRT